MEVKKGEVEAISLTELTIPDDEVLVALQFLLTYHDDHYIIRLQLVSRWLTYVEGDLWRANYHYYDTAEANRKMNLSNYNKLKPLVESKNDEYISLVDDKRRIVYPSAQGTDVIPKPRQPLSGAGLMFRGNDQLGGFLGLKLFTFSEVQHLKDDDLELSPSDTILLKDPKDCRD